MSVADLAARFVASNRKLRIWREWPYVSAADDADTDSWACWHVSREFIMFARGDGVDAQLVHGEEPEYPMAGAHWWVRIGDVDLDFTARQYHNLEYPALPEHADLPCPLIWRTDGRHPVVGAFGRVTVEEA